MGIGRRLLNYVGRQLYQYNEDKFNIKVVIVNKRFSNISL